MSWRCIEATALPCPRLFIFRRVLRQKPEPAPVQLDPALPLHRAKQARKRAPVHAEVLRHPFARNARADDRAGLLRLLRQIALQTGPSGMDSRRTRFSCAQYFSEISSSRLDRSRVHFCPPSLAQH